MRCSEEVFETDPYNIVSVSDVKHTGGGSPGNVAAALQSDYSFRKMRSGRMCTRGCEADETNQWNTLLDMERKMLSVSDISHQLNEYSVGNIYRRHLSSKDDSRCHVDRWTVLENMLDKLLSTTNLGLEDQNIETFSSLYYSAAESSIDTISLLRLLDPMINGMNHHFFYLSSILERSSQVAIQQQCCTEWVIRVSQQLDAVERSLYDVETQLNKFIGTFEDRSSAFCNDLQFFLRT